MNAHQAGYRGVLLFAPSDQPRRTVRALAGDADAVVLDLEDPSRRRKRHASSSPSGAGAALPERRGTG
ncbi:hypothetical protein [Haloechinothrix salitolerans]|uniref:HpcH/HpaI aldolase/citrate lyase family protein n=1 Tax=Haloechinothrix salitolerans TaxID=926830 RepID=A0ABW2C7Q8_9PSEU